jgi:hypothetical protein
LFSNAIFGRDSVTAGETLLQLRPAMARDIILTLARLQGTVDAPVGPHSNEEERGKIHHEHRTLYVNGNNRGEIAVTYFPNTVRPLSIGAAVTDPPASIFPFNGQIAEVALYKRALTDIEVFQRMKATAA